MRSCRRGIIESKLKNPAKLKSILFHLKKQGKRIVFTNGCFDILHYGHVKYLEDAKGKGDVLIVGLNSDSCVRRIKGPKRPINLEYDRSRTIAALESVDYVVLFSEDTPLNLIKLIRPDVLIKGSDWHKNIVGSDFVLSYGGKVLAVKLINGRSTTDLIKKIVKLS